MIVSFSPAPNHHQSRSHIQLLPALISPTTQHTTVLAYNSHLNLLVVTDIGGAPGGHVGGPPGSWIASQSRNDLKRLVAVRQREATTENVLYPERGSLHFPRFAFEPGLSLDGLKSAVANEFDPFTDVGRMLDSNRDAEDF